jgi:all-trans-retinol 13,14-reductase
MLRRIHLQYAGRTTASVLSDLTRDRELVAVLTGQWGDYGLPPGQSSFAIHALLARHYMDGAAYPVGGAGAILAAMAPTIVDAGGVIVVRAEVESLVVERGAVTGVRMADGVVINAPIVISDAGAPNTYLRLLREQSSALERIRADIGRLRPTPAHLCLYVGLQGSASELGLSAPNRWVYPSEDHDGNVERFFADPNAELPVLYFSFPSAKDPSFDSRFPGHSTIDLITFVPYEWFSRWEGTRWRKRGADYDQFKETLKTRLLDALYRELPATRGRVVLAELSTPLTTRHFSNHAHGEIYGIAHSPDRFRCRPLGPRTPIRGLFLTGQDAAMCGFIGALVGGMCAASVVLGRNMFFQLVGQPPK